LSSAVVTVGVRKYILGAHIPGIWQKNPGIEFVFILHGVLLSVQCGKKSVCVSFCLQFWYFRCIRECPVSLWAVLCNGSVLRHWMPRL